MKIGDFVKRNTSLRSWTGLILDHHYTPADPNLGVYVILLVKDKVGRPYRKRVLTYLTKAGLIKVSPVDLDGINKDWLINYKK